MLSHGLHTLTAPLDSPDNLKHCVFVKLTDSSAKYIQEYLKSRDQTNKKPTIVFQKDKGEINFPNGGTNTPRKFLFAVSSIKGAKTDGTSSFECVSYSDEKLRSIGTITQKMTIQATDVEVFQQTRDRVKISLEEEAKNSITVLKSNTGDRHRAKPQSTSVKPKPISAGQSLPAPSANQPAPPKAKLAVDKPIRERIVHLLALKPYTKGELQLRLAKDGLNERDKEAIEPLLQQIGLFNQKTNQYDLQSETVINELKDDWPYYSSAEKQLAKRAINNARSASKTSFNKGASSAFVPFQSVNRQSPITTILPSQNSEISRTTPDLQKTTMKRTSTLNDSATDEDKSSASKKQKLEAPNFKPIGSMSSSSTSSNSSTSSTSSKISPKSQQRQSTKSPWDLLESMEQQQPAPQQQQKQQVKTQSDITAAPVMAEKISYKNEKYSQMKVNSNELNAENSKENPNETKSINEYYLNNYKEIKSVPQRIAYKKDFDACYPEYIELHKYIEPILNSFNSFDEKVRTLDRNSPEFENLQSDIYRKYEERQNDKEFANKRKRYSELYLKLERIRKVIKMYDEKMMNEERANMTL